MTAEQLAYLEWIKEYCNNTFTVDEVETIPPIIETVIDKMIEFDKTTGIQSESLGDYSVTMTTDYPPNILRLLRPYKRVKFI